MSMSIKKTGNPVRLGFTGFFFDAYRYGGIHPNIYYFLYTLLRGSMLCFAVSRFNVISLIVHLPAAFEHPRRLHHCRNLKHQFIWREGTGAPHSVDTAQLFLSQFEVGVCAYAVVFQMA